MSILSNESLITSEVASIKCPKDTEIEKLKQNVHILTLKLSNKHEAINCLKSDIEQIEKDEENQKLNLISEFKSNEIQYQHKIQEQQMELDRLNEQCDSFKSEIDCLKESINWHKIASNKTSNAEFYLEEPVYDLLKIQIEELSEEKQSLVEINCKLKMTVMEHNDCEKKILKMEHLVEDLKHEIDNLNQETSSKDLLLNNLKEEMLGIQAQLDAEKMLNALPLKGNSLFAEVEDRRVVVENELLKFRKENDDLKLELIVAKQASFLLKEQLSSKWACDADKVNEKIYQTLEIDYNKIIEENKNLHNELIKMTDKTKDDFQMELDKILANEAYQPYKKTLKYLESSIKYKSNELEKMRIQLIESMSSNASLKNELNQLKAKLRSLELDLSKLNMSQIRLKLIHEELKLKYEPECCIDKRDIEVQRIASLQAKEQLALIDEGKCDKTEDVSCIYPLYSNKMDSKICLNIMSENSLNTHENLNAKSNKSSLKSKNLLNNSKELFHKRCADKQNLEITGTNSCSKYLQSDQLGAGFDNILNDRQILSEKNSIKNSDQLVNANFAKNNRNILTCNKFKTISDIKENLISQNIISSDNDSNKVLMSLQDEIGHNLSKDCIITKKLSDINWKENFNSCANKLANNNDFEEPMSDNVESIISKNHSIDIHEQSLIQLDIEGSNIIKGLKKSCLNVSHEKYLLDGQNLFTGYNTEENSIYPGVAFKEDDLCNSIASNEKYSFFDSLKPIKKAAKSPKKEKSTDCDSALIPLLCVHG